MKFIKNRFNIKSAQFLYQEKKEGNESINAEYELKNQTPDKVAKKILSKIEKGDIESLSQDIESLNDWDSGYLKELWDHLHNAFETKKAENNDLSEKLNQIQKSLDNLYQAQRQKEFPKRMANELLQVKSRSDFQDKVAEIKNAETAEKVLTELKQIRQDTNDASSNSQNVQGALEGMVKKLKTIEKAEDTTDIDGYAQSIENLTDKQLNTLKTELQARSSADGVVKRIDFIFEAKQKANEIKNVLNNYGTPNINDLPTDWTEGEKAQFIRFVRETTKSISTSEVIAKVNTLETELKNQKNSAEKPEASSLTGIESVETVERSERNRTEVEPKRQTGQPNIETEKSEIELYDSFENVPEMFKKNIHISKEAQEIMNEQAYQFVTEKDILSAIGPKNNDGISIKIPITHRTQATEISLEKNGGNYRVAFKVGNLGTTKINLNGFKISPKSGTPMVKRTFTDGGPGSVAKENRELSSCGAGLIGTDGDLLNQMFENSKKARQAYRSKEQREGWNGMKYDKKIKAAETITKEQRKKFDELYKAQKKKKE